jgi:phosphatidate phosphatase APP1
MKLAPNKYCISIILFLITFSTSLCYASQIKSDEEIIFFPTNAHLDESGKNWIIPIHGWIFEKEDDSLWRKAAVEALLKVLALSSDVIKDELFRQRAGLFLVDNEKGKGIKVRLNDKTFSMNRSGDNGHFSGTMALAIVELEPTDKTRWLSYQATLPEGDTRLFKGRSQLVGMRGISVISDIDDTIKASNVLDKEELLANTFLREFKEVEGMARLYDKWAGEGAVFHYLSNSPWQLYPSLSAFLDEKKFPRGSVHLQSFRLKDRSVFNLSTSPKASKPPRIKKILQMYPHRKFVLVGDSGEKDPEIYAKIAKEHPRQINHVLIRNLRSEEGEEDRYINLFEGIPEDKWTLFTNSDDLMEFNIQQSAEEEKQPLIDNRSKECVVLLHGMARSRFSMYLMEKYLQEKGYRTINEGYPSTKKSIKELAGEEVTAAAKSCRKGGAKKIHFVTHSLGGILTRQYLQSHDLPKGSRIVMLAPPNQGSELADKLKGLDAYKWLNGPAGQELGTGPGSIPNSLKPVDVEIGIIAGDSSLNPFFSSMIPGPDDGKVAVESAKLEEMKDFIIMPSSHSFIMNSSDVMKQTLHFLEEGTFDHSDAAEEESKEIKAFKSDGCSLFPDGTLKDQNLWCNCCYSHDIAYWRGGTKEERKLADQALRDCVEKKTGSKALADLMYAGVRAGGSSIFPAWYRWGYGWPYGRGNKAITAEEEKSVKKRLKELSRKKGNYVCNE